MSHIAEVEVKGTGDPGLDLELLGKGLESIGWALHKGVKTYRWFGRYMNDWPLPKGVKVSDLGTCDHMISIPGSQYQVGVIEKEGGGFAFRFDWWDGALRNAVGGEHGDRIKQMFAAARLRHELEGMGAEVDVDETLDGGRIHIHIGGE